MTRKITYLLLAILAIFVLPFVGAWLYYDGVFPPGFFAYPPLKPIEKAPFSLPVFILIALASVGVAAVYLFPQWFGFKKVPLPEQPEQPKVGYPLWFWLGLVAWLGTLILLWSKARQPLWYLHWSDLPLFWGFIFFLDGIVYKRNGGRSLIGEVPQEVVGIGLCSTLGWMLFEYLNFFVDDNWFYPNGGIISSEQFLLYAIIISSGLLTMAFEWYSLFTSFPALRQRFSQGIKIILPEWVKNVCLLLALGGLFGSGLLPDTLFFSLWLAPPLLLAVALDKIGVWTPLRPIGRGNWTPTLLFSLTYLVQGLCLECQNYFSGTHDADGNLIFSEAPAYWVYSLPYVQTAKIFEMPVLGYLGYLPFGLYCWIWWITTATLLGIPSKFYREHPFHS